MKSVFAKTLYQKRFMCLGWFIGCLAIVTFTLAFFNSFSNGALGQSLQNLPPSLQKLVGDTASWRTIDGYISQQIFALRVPLLMVILAIAALISVSGTEEQQGLAETQLTLPIGRTKLLLHKFAAAAIVVVVGGAGVLAGVALGVALNHKSYDLFNVFPELVSVVTLALNYGLVGFAIASVTGRRGWALGAASGIAFSSYLINTMAVSVTSLQAVDKLTLFHYYSTAGAYNWHNLFLQLAVGATLLLVSVVGFNRRDIRAR